MRAYRCIYMHNAYAAKRTSPTSSFFSLISPPRPAPFHNLLQNEKFFLISTPLCASCAPPRRSTRIRHPRPEIAGEGRLSTLEKGKQLDESVLTHQCPECQSHGDIRPPATLVLLPLPRSGDSDNTPAPPTLPTPSIPGKSVGHARHRHRRKAFLVNVQLFWQSLPATLSLLPSHFPTREFKLYH